jgi:hypothetical protein
MSYFMYWFVTQMIDVTKGYSRELPAINLMSWMTTLIPVRSIARAWMCFIISKMILLKPSSRARGNAAWWPMLQWSSFPTFRVDVWPFLESSTKSPFEVISRVKWRYGGLDLYQVSDLPSCGKLEETRLQVSVYPWLTNVVVTKK